VELGARENESASRFHRDRICIRAATLYSAMPARRPTLRETEIKLRVADLPGLLHKLGRLRASCLGRVFERNTLYDTLDSDLRRQGYLLRVRIATPALSRMVRGGQAGAWITSKRPAPARAQSRGLSRYKVKLEREAVLPSVRGFAASLRSLGFRPGFLYEKFRTTFRLPGLHLDLDETPVGVFLEIEGRPRAINRAARALGYSPCDYIRSTYWDLYAADCRRRGRIPRNMLFPA
jgi:adenylate cyclase, class 2